MPSQPYLVLSWLMVFPRMTTLVCGVQVVSDAELRVPQCTEPSSCLRMMPPNEQSWTTLFSTRTSLKRVFTAVPVPACTSNTMPPVFFACPSRSGT